ncbi:MAG: hypothetical protein J6K78_04240 [Tidjanibacter sp.]|nr:hypothetical protein [Tidjanibacter sp.]
MKKLVILFAVALGVCSCGTTMPTPDLGGVYNSVMTSPEPKLISTSTHTRVSVAQPIVAVFADLQVSPEKILFFYLPSKTVVKGGEDNVIDSAVREALLSNGNADVMVGLETQIKYNDEGEPESVTVTGYPAKYVNFRNPGDDYLKTLSAPAPAPKSEKAAASPIGGFNFGK